MKDKSFKLRFAAFVVFHASKATIPRKGNFRVAKAMVIKMNIKECKTKLYCLLSEKFNTKLNGDENDKTHFADPPFNFSEIQLVQFFFEVEILFKVKFNEEDLLNEQFTTINNVAALILGAI